MNEGGLVRFGRVMLAIIILAALAQPALAQSPDSLEIRSLHMHAVFTSGASLDAILEFLPRPAVHFTRDSRLPGEEAYAIDGTMYVHSRGNVWKKFHVARPPAPNANFLEHFAQIARAYEDLNPGAGSTVVEGGVTYGMARVRISIPFVTGSESDGRIETCSYDLKTYQPHTCTTPVATVHFSAFNDPADAIALPPAALAAPLFNVPAAK